MRRKPIYVETFIKGKLSDVWNYTQEPQLHERWDLRFSSITYLPKEDDIQPFLYKTNIGFGKSIAGEGRSKGSKQLQDGSRLSTLEFGTDQRISLIKKGSGFWKYEEKEEGIRFYTKYDYETRFGLFGAVFDRAIFRPLIGWATSWSFDTLKLWIEKGVPPEQSIRRLITNLLICFVLAFIWIYQGLIPKVVFPHTGEIQLLQEAGVFLGVELYAVRVIGIFEILVGILFLLPIRKKLLFLLSSLFVFLLGVGALITNLEIYLLPFNPATLNIAMITLGLVGFINQNDLPVARNCIRRMSK